MSDVACDLRFYFAQLLVVFLAYGKHFIKFESKHHNAIQIWFVFAPIIECFGVDL